MVNMNKLEEKMMPITMKISNNKELVAVRDSMYLLMPFLIIGSFFLLMAAFPVPGYADLMLSLFGEGWDSYLLKITDATFGIMAIFVILGTSYHYARNFKVDGLMAPMVTFVFFMIITPFENGAIPLQWLGASGMFMGILTGLIVTRVFCYLYNKEMFPTMPAGVPPGVMKSFNSLVPILGLAISALLINVLVSFTSFDSLHAIEYKILSTPLLLVGNTLPGIIFAEGLAEFLWFFGIHGNNIVSSVMQPIWLELAAQNLEMTQAGLEPVNIITQQFKDTYLLIGGSGATLPLLFVILLTSKSKHLKMVASLALIPGLFNINEPVIFGLPIVLNPILFIPFIITPAVFATITYFSMSLGLVGITNGLIIPWTTPTILSGLLVSGPSGAVLQIILIIVGMLIYYPFIKMLDKQLIKEQEPETVEESIE